MALAPFIWKDGRAMTPDQIARERKMVDAVQGRAGDTSPVAHWTAGAARVVDALGGVLRERRADKAEAAGMAGADKAVANNPVLAALLGGGQGGAPVYASPASQGMAAEPMDPARAVAGDAMAALGKATPATPEAIRAGLVARGLPEHVADGFVMNFKDESGLNPGINEIAPLVPGSRGGFGLYQLTGPRRVAYEAYAQERGLPLDSVDAQLDFMMQELQGPEAAAASSILSAPDAGTAAAAIVNDFLRPSPEYREARAAKYTGGGGMTDAGTPAPITGGGPNVVSALSAAMSDPWVAKKYGPVISALMDQEMQRGQMQYEQQLRQSDPMYQAQLAQLTTPEPVDPWAGTQIINGQVVRMGANGPEAIGNFNTPEPGFTMVTPEEAAALGLPEGAYQKGADGKISQIGGGGTTINNNMPGADGIPELGKLSTDYTYETNPDGTIKRDANGRPIAVPVTGSPAAMEAEAAAAARDRRELAKSTEADVIITAAQRARDAAANRNFGATGSGLVGWAFPQSDSGEVIRQVNTLKSNGTFSALQQMRENSPTGAALGAASDRDLQLLAEKAGALDPNSPNIQRDLDDYERTLLRTLYGPEDGDRIFEETRQGALPPPDGDGWQTINGVRVRVKQ